MSTCTPKTLVNFIFDSETGFNTHARPNRLCHEALNPAQICTCVSEFQIPQNTRTHP